MHRGGSIPGRTLLYQQHEKLSQNDMEELIQEINQHHPLDRNLNIKIIVNFEEQKHDTNGYTS